jgi:hypothetical protein
MGKHEEISEATRAEVRDDWVVTRGVSRTAQKFGLTNQAVKPLFRALRPFRSEKITKNFALPDRRRIFAVFLHGLGRQQPIAIKTLSGS